jgi:hypothetical protein
LAKRTLLLLLLLLLAGNAAGAGGCEDAGTLAALVLVATESSCGVA